MGHTLTAITSSIFHEVQNFTVGDAVKRRQLRRNFASACERYCREALTIENFLEQFGLRAKDHELDEEFCFIMEFAFSSKALGDVQSKALLALK